MGFPARRAVVGRASSTLAVSRMAGFALAAGLSFVSAAPVQAAIRCKGDAQWSGGRWIVTPYCEDKNLAEVARSYGIKTSFQAIRYSTSEKQRVCSAIGHDTRVSQACVGYRPQDNERRFIIR